MRQYSLAALLIFATCGTPPRRVLLPEEAVRPENQRSPSAPKTRALTRAPESRPDVFTSTAYVIIAGELAGHAAAVGAAKRLSSTARLPISDTLRRPPAELRLAGKVVSLHRPRPGRFVVTAFMGLEQSVARELLGRVRQHAPTARIVQRTITNFDRLPTYDEYVLSRVVILASIQRCTAAMRAARRIARSTGVPFSSRGLACDAKRGLTWPSNYTDEILAGSYFGRRYNDCGTGKLAECISVERADFYGFRAGYHVVVGGIYADQEARQALARYRKAVPSAYAKDASIYFGCIH